MIEPVNPVKRTGEGLRGGTLDGIALAARGQA